MTTDQKDFRYWRQQPDRDEVINKLYAFVHALAENEPEKASALLETGNFDRFCRKLNAALQNYAFMNIEDDELEKMGANLMRFLVKPDETNENDFSPEFSGNQFVVSPGEAFSILLVFAEMVTDIRIHFSLAKTDNLYYVKFESVERLN